MAHEVSPNLKYHSWHLGVRNQEADEEAPALVMVRGSEFNPNKEKNFEEDHGHMGTSSTLIGKYASEATSEPEFTDMCRYTEGWEDIWLIALGSDDGEGNIRKTVLTEGVNKFDFGINIAKPQEPYFCTLYNGFSVTDNDGWKYEDCLMNQLSMSGANNEAPTYTAQFISNYPKFRQPNPTNIIPATTVFPKSSNVSIYMAPVGTYTLETIQQYKFACYKEWNFELNFNVESDPCSDDDFGTTTKVQGELDGTFGMTIPWKENTKNLEYNFATGSDDTSLTSVTDETYSRTVWIVMENGKIASTAYNYQTIIKIPEMLVTAADSPQSGTEAKTIEISGDLIQSATASIVETSIITSLNDLHISTVNATNP